MIDFMRYQKGNWIISPAGKWQEIGGLWMDKGNIIGIVPSGSEAKSLADAYPAADCSPIPITDAVASAIGIRWLKSIGSGSNIASGRWLDAGGKQTFYYQDGVVFVKDSSKQPATVIAECRYVHEVQNLYAELAGEALYISGL